MSGVMKRVRDITVATLNDKLDKAEDPVKLIDTYLASQREQIVQSEQLYRQCAKHMEAMREQYLSAAILTEKREEQARIALKVGEEDIARMALQDKMLNDEKQYQYKGLYEQAKQSASDLENQLNQLRADYDEVLAKRQYYAARMETIRLRQRMNERMNQGGAFGAQGAFRRLEEQVSDLELETSSLSELRRITQEQLFRVGNTVKESLESELRKLKLKLEKEGASRL